MNNIIPIRPFQSVRKETRRVGCPVFHKAQVRRVLRELEQGKSGMSVAGELLMARLLAGSNPGRAA
ncbi:MAG TPA: hypothetical protein VFE72_06030 [Lysobacter sp.]|nr:hypothetical protein [Lysobacter sp.]